MAKKKKLLIGTLAICLVAALAIGGTLAFLTSTAQKTNVFTIGDDIEIDLDEPNWDPDDGEELFPGDTMTKDPTITGIAGDSYARLKVSFIDRSMEINPAYAENLSGEEPEFIPTSTNGSVITDPDRIALILLTIYYDEDGADSLNIVAGKKYSLEDVEDWLGYNEDDFTLVSSSDGVFYYNYNGILAKDDSATLFTHIVIPTDWNSETMAKLGNYDIEVVAQAIQATGFTSAADAYDALDDELEAQAATEPEEPVVP